MRNEIAINRVFFWFGLLSGVTLILRGLSTHPNMIVSIWTDLALQRFLLASAIYFLVAVLLFIFKPLRPVFPVILVLAFSLLFFSSGISAFFTVGLLLASSYSIGRWLLPWVNRVYGIPIGLAVLSFVFQLLAHFPVNYPSLHIALLGMFCSIHFRERLLEVSRTFQSAYKERYNLQFYFGMALVGYGLLVQAFYIARPEVSFDALSYQLLPLGELFYRHRWHFDPSKNCLALTTFGSNWLLASAYIMGGEAASRWLNFVFLSLTLPILNHAIKTLKPLWRALCLLCFLSIPIVNLETAALFIENLQLLFFIASVCLILEGIETGRAQEFIGLAIFLGGIIAVKSTGFVFGAVLSPWILWLIFKGWKRKWITQFDFLKAAVAFFLIGLTSYSYSFIRSGNPVLPFMNGVFKSRFFEPTNFNNSLFNTPFTLTSLYHMTFNSDRYLEGSSGSIGFFFLFFAPLCVLLIAFSRRFSIWMLVLTFFGSLILCFRFQSYLRYVYPVFPLFVVAIFLLVFSPDLYLRKLEKSVFALSCIVMVGINFLLRPAAAGIFRDFDYHLLFGKNTSRAYLETFAPERQAIEYLNLRYGDHYVLYQDRTPYGAFAQGNVVSRFWHHYTFANQISSAKTLEDLKILFQRNGVTHLVWEGDSSSAQNRAGGSNLLAQFLSDYSEPEASFSYIEVRRMNYSKGLK